MTDLSRTALADAPRALRDLTGKAAPPYSRLYRLILNGKLTAERVDGRYTLDIPAAAKELGLLA